MRRMRHLKPREIQGCQLALDASIPSSLYDATSGGNLVAADGAIARWEDQSGNARHVTQGTGANQPLRKVATVNGQDTARFDGTNDSLNVTLTGSDPNTICATVVRRATQSSYRVLVNYGTTSATGSFLILRGPSDFVCAFTATQQSSTYTAVNDTPFVAALIDNGASGGAFFINATAAGTYTGNAVAQGVASVIGGHASSSQSAQADMCSVGIWNIALPEFVRKRFDQGQQRKWRING